MDRYPEAALSDRPGQVKAVKRRAARCGRTFHDRAAHMTARVKLAALFRDVDVPSLRYWAQVTMIDSRFDGATGTGAYWAVASRCCNELARLELRERGKGRPMFDTR